MSNVPADLKYIDSHEWLRKEADGSYTVGITFHAQELLGDMVFVELPEVGELLNKGEECAVAESVKAASDIYSPITGTVTEVNSELEDSPELINSSPYGDGWLFKLAPSLNDELDELLSADDYRSLIEE